MVVVSALVAAGEIVLSVSGIKYDASKLSDLARAGIDNLIKFKHLEQSLEKVKQKSNDEGLPYQTLISSIIHKYDLSNKLLPARNFARFFCGIAKSGAAQTFF
jgi:hypothetical protein